MNHLNALLPELQSALLQEFTGLYQKYHQQQLYAFVLMLDSLYMPHYALVSTRQSLLNEEENRHQYLAGRDKWDISKWQYRSPPHSELIHLRKQLSSSFSQIQLQSTQIHSQESLRHQIVRFYLEGLQSVKKMAAQQAQLNPERCLFLIYQVDNSKLVLESLNRLNSASPLLTEAQQFFSADQNHTIRKKYRLTQIDKDILIDLGQILELVPYDDLQVAHQAYLLTLEPYFAEVNPFIQHLIHDVASMDSGILVMSKQEIQFRIQQFYR